MPNASIIIYAIVGIIVTYFDFEILYKKEYDELKAKREAQDAAVCIMLMFMIFLWPLLIVWRYVKFLVNVKRGKYKFQ